MPETIHETLRSETTYSLRSFALTKDDVPTTITSDARTLACPDHPDVGSHPGMGYAGGGFGSYRRCNACDRVFGKVAMKDGNDQ